MKKFFSLRETGAMAVLDPLERIDDATIPDAPSEVRLFIVARNEALRLPYLLEHYKGQGVGRFFIVDNGSTDATQRVVGNIPEAHLFYTEESYKDKAGIGWINTLLDNFGVGHWCLVVDADELLVYPHSDLASIPQLCEFLDKNNETALFTVLLDMYPGVPVAEAEYKMGRPFLDLANFFDRGPYYVSASKNFPYLQVRGGVRKRIFWPGSAYNHGPSLTKVPLIKWQRGFEYTGSTHALRPGAKLAQLTGALLHFKYFSDFANNAQKEYARQDRPHLDEYRRYAELMADEPNVTFKSDSSIAFKEPDQLVELGLIRATWAWSKFVKERESTAETRKLTRERLLSIYSAAVQQRRVTPEQALNLLGLFQKR